jgi:hypothetical protein
MLTSCCSSRNPYGFSGIWRWIYQVVVARKRYVVLIYFIKNDVELNVLQEYFDIAMAKVSTLDMKL